MLVYYKKLYIGREEKKEKEKRREREKERERNRRGKAQKYDFAPVIDD